MLVKNDEILFQTNTENKFITTKAMKIEFNKLNLTNF